MTNINSILIKNELAIEKWINKPKFKSKMNIIDQIKFLHDIKRYFIISELNKLYNKQQKKLQVFDFGSGQGGLTIDIKTALKDKINIFGYDVSKKAISIAREAALTFSPNIEFIFDPQCDPRQVLKGKFDAIISCDVFGHVASIPNTFKILNEMLNENGKLIAFSETITGKSLKIPQLLTRNGYRMDDSEEEHISLHSVFEIENFLNCAGFIKIKIYPYEPIRFPFYPKRYLSKLLQIKSPLVFPAAIFSIFQNRITEIIYNQINLRLAKNISLKDTAGCLIIATKNNK